MTAASHRHPTIEWAGESLGLLPARALWWPRERTLFIADTHFGKASTFRHFGIPVPEESHDDDLARLSSVLHATNAEHLVILGDFLHAPTGCTPDVMQSIASWRAKHEQLAITLILGNHDRKAGVPLEEWNIKTCALPTQIGPFECHHEPPDSEETGTKYCLAGHLHPAHRLSERTGSGISSRCFIVKEHLAILPAFGSFTGSHYPRTDQGDRTFIIGPDEVIEIPSAARIKG